MSDVDASDQQEDEETTFGGCIMRGRVEVHRHRLVPQRLRLCNDPVNEVAMAAPLKPLVPAADIKVDVLGKHSLVVLMENPSF